MQTANIVLALGGDQKNTVPKYGVTAAEIAVLQAIHGDQAVTDVEPLEEITRTNRAELQRLKSVYGGAKDNNNTALVEIMFPGVAARVHESLNELSLDESQMKAKERVAIPAKSLKKVVAVEHPEDEQEELEADDLEEDDVEDAPEKVDYTKVTVKDLKQLLDRREIDYDLRAHKDDLIALAVNWDLEHAADANTNVLD